MKKIQSLFMRNYDGDRLVYNEILKGSEWVINGEGVATRKWEGTSCLVKNGILYKRYDAKHGKTPPNEFIAAQEPDLITGHWPGWLPVSNIPNDVRHNEPPIPKEDGTYELCGEKVQGNPERIKGHVFIKHGADIITDCPRDYDGIKNYLTSANIEGIVWHHPDGRMVKIKTKDFGLKRI